MSAPTPLWDADQLAAKVGELCRLEGRFELRSGTIASTYFDKYLFEADPTVLSAVAMRLAELIPPGTEVLAGLELGGVPVATALSLTSGLPVAFVRKAAKSYGTAKLAEGVDVDGRRVLVVEDVITTGGQVVRSTEELRARGARVDTVLCVIDRSDGDHGNLEAADLSIISLFTAADLAVTAVSDLGLVRPMTSGDVAEIVCADQLAAAGDAERLAFLQTAVVAGHCLGFVDAEGIAGFVVTSPGRFFGRDFVELLTVHPDRRRAGIGRRLLRAAVANAASDKVFTSTNRSNAPMRALLESEGWMISGELSGLDDGDPEIVFFTESHFPLGD